MFSKFAVQFLKSSPIKSRAKFLSTTANPTIASKQEAEKAKKTWRYEIAGVCDTKNIISFVNQHFMKEEPLYRALIPDCKCEKLEKMFRESIDQGLTVVARKCTEDEAIIGVTISERSRKLDGIKLCQLSKEANNCDMKKFFETLAIINIEPQIHEKLCQDELFKVSAVSVAESHCGKNIGLDLVGRSLQLARDRNFNFATITCTSDNIRKIAEQHNMQKFWTTSYTELLNRTCEKPRAMPEPPHNNVSVYYMDLKTLPPKC